MVGSSKSMHSPSPETAIPRASGHIPAPSGSRAMGLSDGVAAWPREVGGRRLEPESWSLGLGTHRFLVPLWGGPCYHSWPSPQIAGSPFPICPALPASPPSPVSLFPSLGHPGNRGIPQKPLIIHNIKTYQTGKKACRICNQG